MNKFQRIDSIKVIEFQKSISNIKTKIKLDSILQSDSPGGALLKNDSKSKRKNNQNIERERIFVYLIEQKRNFKLSKHFSLYKNHYQFFEFEKSRRFIICDELKMQELFFKNTLKIIKHYLIKKECNVDVLNTLLLQGVSSFRYWFKFLTIIINKFINKMDPDLIMSNDFNDYPSLNNSINKEYYFEDIYQCYQNIPSFLEMINDHANSQQCSLNLRYEANEFVKSYLETLIIYGIIMKRNKNLFEAYLYLKKSHHIAKNIHFTKNTDILHTCAKAHLSYAVYLLEMKRFEKSIKVLDLALLISQIEIDYLINKKYSNQSRIKYGKAKMRRAIKTLYTVLVNLIVCYENKKDGIKIYEITKLMSFLACFLIFPLDEYRQSIIKIYKQGKNRFNHYSIELSEIENVIFNFLSESSIFEKIKINYNPDDEQLEKDYIYQFHNKFYKKFAKKLKLNELIQEKARIDNIKNLKRFSTKIHETLMPIIISNIEELKKKKTEGGVQNKNSELSERKRSSIKSKTYIQNKVIDAFASNVKDREEFNQIFDNSFVNSEQNTSYVKTSFHDDDLQYKQINMILKKGLATERGKEKVKYFRKFKNDHKPKVLTSNIYFLNNNTENNETENFNKKTESILIDSHRLYPREIRSKNHKDNQTIDFCEDFFKRKVSKSFKNNTNFKNNEILNNQFFTNMKSEEFIDKDFRFARKMIHNKKNEIFNNFIKPKIVKMKESLKANIKLRSERIYSITQSENSAREIQKESWRNKLVKKILEKKKLNKNENQFVIQENLKKKSLKEILFSNQKYFHLEDYAKTQEKKNADKEKRKVILSEKKKRNSIRAGISLDDLNISNKNSPIGKKNIYHKNIEISKIASRIFISKNKKSNEKVRFRDKKEIDNRLITENINNLIINNVKHQLKEVKNIIEEEKNKDKELEEKINNITEEKKQKIFYQMNELSSSTFLFHQRKQNYFDT